MECVLSIEYLVSVENEVKWLRRETIRHKADAHTGAAMVLQPKIKEMSLKLRCPSVRY